MADIVTSGSVPPGTAFRYRDMGDGTHALVVELRDTASGGNDVVTSNGIPVATQFRYADRGDGTFALVQARG